MNPAAVGGILQGGASVLGALGVGGAKFKSWHGRENARNEWFNLSGDLESANYYDAVRRGAEKAGFNPLTALGMAPSVGSAAGGMTQPKLASLDMLMGGLKGISDEFTGVASQQRAREQLQLDLAKVELDKARASASAVITPPPNRASGGPALGRNAQRIGPVTVNRATEREGISVLGMDIEPALGTSNAEDAEKRYGDLVSSAMGVLTLSADVGKTARKYTDRGFNALNNVYKNLDRSQAGRGPRPSWLPNHVNP